MHFLFVLSPDSPDLVLAPVAHTLDAYSYSWLKKRTAHHQIIFAFVLGENDSPYL